MDTPAWTLARTLESVVNDGRRNNLLLSVIAGSLGLVGEDADTQVLIRLRDLTMKSHKIIDGLPFNENGKNIARQYLSPIDGFRNFSAFHLTLDQAANPMLHPSTIQGLDALHMMLASHVSGVILSEPVLVASNHLREAMDSVRGLEIDLKLKEAILKRIVQVIEAVDNFSFFGPDQIKEKIDALIGQIALQQVGATNATKVVLKKIGSYAAAIAAAFILADSAVDAALGLTENLPKLIEDFSGSSNLPNDPQ